MKKYQLKSIKVYLLIFDNFGFWNGTIFFFKIILGFVETIKVPGIKQKITLRKRSSDFPTFSQVFIENQYSFVDIPIKFSPSTIIDAGANIGLFSVLMKNKFPESKVISIEPDKDNFSIMRKNLMGYSNIFLENCGLWNIETRLNIHDKFSLGKWGMVVEEDEKNGVISAISMNYLLKKYNIEIIDILKIDIETSEKKLFEKGYENWLPLVKIIIIELHDRFEDGCSKPFFEAINICFKKYKLIVQGENIIIINEDLG